jgi:hypothetical protein
MRQQINRFIRRVTATESRPEIRWSEVIRIEALGTDALGAFEVSITFIYESGAQATVSPHHKGYGAILDELPQRFPSMPSNWLVQMSQQPAC